MRNPGNRFKQALRKGRHQLGVFSTIGGNTVPELLAGAGFDWVLIDCEHAPYETADVLPALQAIGQFPDVSAIVRPASNDPVAFKRILDMGAQSFLVPYIETAEEAAQAVSAIRYAPRGIRGAAGMTRATRYGRVETYFENVEDDLCLITQIETVKGVKNMADIAAVDGVDALFIGPTDLSASMGLPGQVNHPDVQAAIVAALEAAREIGIPCGIMCLDTEIAHQRIANGSSFTAVGVDLVMLATAVKQLRDAF